MFIFLSLTNKYVYKNEKIQFINGKAKCFLKHIQVNVHKKTGVPHKQHCYFKGNNLVYIKGNIFLFHTPTIADYEK